MIENLDRLTVTDFRSVKGSILVPLDAPIVLIHGANGAGKTSVLSALELALTGDIAVMHRDDPSFPTYLVHQGAQRATVTLSGRDNSTDDIRPRSITVGEGTITGQALLDPPSAQFFSERCYLAQSVLGRLLEIYQHAVPQRDSALTRFVKDLLGLDQLDALIDGLHDAGDIRRTRNLAPEFRAADDRCRALRARRDTANGAHRQQSVALGAARRAFIDIVASLPATLVGISPPVTDIPAMSALLERTSEDPPLVLLAQHRRELASIRKAWFELPGDLSAAERAAAEAAESEAGAEVAIWRDGSGVALDALLEGLRSIFPDLPSSVSTDPKTAHGVAVTRVTAETHRLQAVLGQEREATARVSALDEDIGRAEARIKIVDDQIATLAKDASILSQALATLTPHIHGDDCPVCGRDFSEVSAEPLIGYVQQKIARLTEQATRLSALALEKSDATGRLSGLQRERETQHSKRLRPEDLATLQARLANLTRSATALTDLNSAAELGTTATRRLATAQRQLAQVRDRDRIATDLRISTAALCATLEQTELGESESVAVALDRLQQFITGEQARLESLRNTRLRALSACRHLAETESAATKAQEEVETLIAELKREEDAFNLADARRLQARTIWQAARDSRTAIVRRVFDDSLNSLWRDLFVRLAPTEPFVPAFKLPETTGDVVATLETLHWSGQRGGTPGAMLSAGNMNTAALTLFLALHLSVKARLPWLVLDDPVQSMDEVHIAQFAALLRTLSKAHGRKILLAVHDRPLFDYLTLELSPAFAQDQLITVELSRSGANATIAETRYWTFQKDEAIAA